MIKFKIVPIIDKSEILIHVQQDKGPLKIFTAEWLIDKNIANFAYYVYFNTRGNYIISDKDYKDSLIFIGFFTTNKYGIIINSKTFTKEIE